MTFTDLRGLSKPPNGSNLGDPGLVADRSGNFYASYVEFDPSRPPGFRYAVGVSKSTNGGATFGAPKAPPPTGVFPSSFPDKPFIAVGPNGFVYVTWTNFGPSPNLPIMFSQSVDGGNTFSIPIQLTGLTQFSQGSQPVVGPDGALYVVWEQLFDLANPTAPSEIVIRKSTDGGITFGPQVIAAPVSEIGFGGGTLLGNFRVNSFPRVDVSPVTGTIHLVFASNPQTFLPTGDSGDIYYTSSTDGGSTWSPPIVLNDDGTLNDQFFPDVGVNSDGTVKVFWYDKRNDPANLMIDVFETESFDDGASFTANTRVKGVSFPPAVGYDPILVSTYMGDYIDMKSITTPNGPGSTFLLSWGDNRRAITALGGRRNDQDVFFTTQ